MSRYSNYFFNCLPPIDKTLRVCYNGGMIRKLTSEDKDLFLALSAEFYASPAVAHPVPAQYHARAFEELMRAEEYIVCFILCDGNVPAGYALLQKTYSREGGGLTIWIDEIYLRPAFRGKGLGREFFAFADTLGAARYRLEVEPDNARAIQLYASLGFEPLPYLQMVKEKG